MNITHQMIALMKDGRSRTSREMADSMQTGVHNVRILCGTLQDAGNLISTPVLYFLTDEGYRRNDTTPRYGMCITRKIVQHMTDGVKRSVIQIATELDQDAGVVRDIVGALRQRKALSSTPVLYTITDKGMGYVIPKAVVKVVANKRIVDRALSSQPALVQAWGRMAVGAGA